MSVTVTATSGHIAKLTAVPVSSVRRLAADLALNVVYASVGRGLWSCQMPQAEQAARRTAEAMLAQERAQRKAEAAQLEASRQEVAAQKAALTALQARQRTLRTAVLLHRVCCHPGVLCESAALPQWCHEHQMHPGAPTLKPFHEAIVTACPMASITMSAARCVWAPEQRPTKRFLAARCRRSLRASCGGLAQTWALASPARQARSYESAGRSAAT